MSSRRSARFSADVRAAANRCPAARRWRFTPARLAAGRQPNDGPGRAQTSGLDSLDEARAKRFLQDPTEASGKASNSAHCRKLEDRCVAAADPRVQRLPCSARCSYAGLVFPGCGPWRSVGGLSLALVLGTGAIAIGSFRPQAIGGTALPGLLAKAPGRRRRRAHDRQTSFDAYRVELQIGPGHETSAGCTRP